MYEVEIGGRAQPFRLDLASSWGGDSTTAISRWLRSANSTAATTLRRVQPDSPPSVNSIQGLPTSRLVMAAPSKYTVMYLADPLPWKQSGYSKIRALCPCRYPSRHGTCRKERKRKQTKTSMSASSRYGADIARHPKTLPDYFLEYGPARGGLSVLSPRQVPQARTVPIMQGSNPTPDANVGFAGSLSLRRSTRGRFLTTPHPPSVSHDIRGTPLLDHCRIVSLFRRALYKRGRAGRSRRCHDPFFSSSVHTHTYCSLGEESDRRCPAE